MQNTDCPLCWVEAHTGNPSNPLVMRPSFAIPPTYRTPIVRFYFLTIDHILKVVTSNRQVIARLEILRERAEGEEVEKINNIISNIKEINKEIIEMKTSMERRGELPTYEPLRFRYTADLDRRTKTETLISVTWRPLRNSYRFLERGKGSLRGLRSRLLEVGQTEEARNVEREMEKLTEIGMDLHKKQRQIQELKVGNPVTHSRGDCPLCWIEAHIGNPGNPGNPGGLVGLEAYFGEAVPVLRTERAPVLEKVKPGIPFKIKITYSKYVLSPHEAITEGMMRGMGYRSSERTMKIRVTIPWLKWEYAQKIDEVMADILFYTTKRHKREREESAHVYLRETSTLHSGTEADRAANLAEYTAKVRRVLDKLYDEGKEWEPVAVRAHS